MRKEFEDDTLIKEDPDTFTHFADKFIVEVKHLVSYVDHLTLLRNKKIKRKTARTKLRDRSISKGKLIQIIIGRKW